MDGCFFCDLLLTARYPGTPEAFWRGNVYDWPQAPRGDAAQVAALCDQLQGWFEASSA